jgi:hypothetical protein
MIHKNKRAHHALQPKGQNPFHLHARRKCGLSGVHLYRLAEADASIHVREVRFLFYGTKSTRLAFDDVMLAAQLNSSGSQAQA